MIDHGERACRCDRVRKAAGQVMPFNPALDCGPCFVFWTHPEINKAWGGIGALPIRKTTLTPATKAERAIARTFDVAEALNPPCRYRSLEPVRLELCSTCSQKKDVPIHHCSKFETDCFTGSLHPEGCRSCMQCAASDVGREERLGLTLAKRRDPSTVPHALFASHYLERDGAPTLLANLVTRLRGFSCSVFSWHDGPMRETYEAAGVPVAIGKVPDLAGVDLVVANTIAAAAAVKAAKLAGVPCVWWIHESDPEMCSNLDEVREVIDYPRLIVFPSQSTADAYAHLRSNGVRVIPALVPPVPIRDRAACRAKLGISEREFAVVTMGRDEPRKGQADIREAIAGLDGVRLFAVHGDLDQWSYYAAADLYVCSSRIEALPLAIQEAQAYGVPVLTTPVFGCRDLVADPDRWYQPGDSAELRRKIVREKKRFDNDRN